MPAKFGQKFHSSFCFKIATDLNDANVFEDEMELLKR